MLVLDTASGHYSQQFLWKLSMNEAMKFLAPHLHILISSFLKDEEQGKERGAYCAHCHTYS
jgi:hypothetical protein